MQRNRPTLNRNTRYNPAERQQGNDVALIVPIVFLFIGFFVLLPIFPPFGLIWCILAGKGLFDTLVKQGKVKKNVEGKIDWSAAKTTSREAGRKLLSHMKAEDAMEEKYKSHPHTPISYSYDACAKEKRLEQINTLKDAGLLSDAEYKKRNQDIMAGK